MSLDNFGAMSEIIAEFMRKTAAITRNDEQRATKAPGYPPEALSGKVGSVECETKVTPAGKSVTFEHVVF